MGLVHSSVSGLLFFFQVKGVCWAVSKPQQTARITSSGRPLSSFHSDCPQICCSFSAKLMSLRGSRVDKVGILVVCLITSYIIQFVAVDVFYSLSILVRKAPHQAPILESCSVIFCLYIAQNTVIMTLLVSKEDKMLHSIQRYLLGLVVVFQSYKNFS